MIIHTLVYSFPAAMIQQDREQFFSEVEWTRMGYTRLSSAASLSSTTSTSSPASPPPTVTR